ncbi:MAG: type II toxin-antitoxin system RelB/DinJ family antitoxin [Betaproteobacteria bacterium]|nr:type II toxin-antitoxin system RelB/DinJ family antitoxin [Betaproteobacteria bacterium]
MYLSTEIRSRIEPELKEQAQRVLDECGLNLSDAIRLFLRQIVATGGLPFEVKAPNAATQAAMLEARQVRARYATAKDLFDDLEGKRKTKKKRSHKKV